MKGINHFSDERMKVVVLDNGCMCCTVRGDLLGAFASILTKMEEAASKERTSAGRALDSVLIETTGMADPVPIVRTLLQVRHAHGRDVKKRSCSCCRHGLCPFAVVLSAGRVSINSKNVFVPAKYGTSVASGKKAGRFLREASAIRAETEMENLAEASFRRYPILLFLFYFFFLHPFWY